MATPDADTKYTAMSLPCDERYIRKSDVKFLELYSGPISKLVEYEAEGKSLSDPEVQVAKRQMLEQAKELLIMLNYSYLTDMGYFIVPDKNGQPSLSEEGPGLSLEEIKSRGTQYIWEMLDVVKDLMLQ